MAGALIGLGLLSLGVGERYSHLSQPDSKGDFLVRDADGNITRGPISASTPPIWLKFSEMDRALTTALVVLVLALIIGLVTAFLGLAFHHHRRLHEMLQGLHPPHQP
jgi:hypothetical protein